MRMLRAHYRHPEFRVGVQDFVRTAPGIAAWGLAFSGMLVYLPLHLGLGW